MEALAEGWKSVQADLDSVRKARSNMEDNHKMATMQQMVSEQLQEYGFTSVAPEEIVVSNDTYLPTLAGFNLGLYLSASDMVRLIWSYTLGLLEVSRRFETNHPGLVILDEPRQQDTSYEAFRALLRRAASAKMAGHQIICATSTQAEEVRSMLAGVEHTYHEFQGPIIRRRES
jgi:hypothetical protein